MKTLTAEYFQDLLAARTPPRVSLYMPALAGMPMAAENGRRYGDLLEKAVAELRQVFHASEAQKILEPMRRLAEPEPFWRELDKGLAVFADAGGFIRHFKLPREVREEVHVADNFHLKHLIRAHQFSGLYEVLCLSLKDVRLFQGNQDGLRRFDLPDVPRSIDEALATAVGGRHVTPGNDVKPVRRWELIARNTAGPDDEQFFRIVDQAFWEFHSREAGLPVILCGDEKRIDLFRSVTKNPNVVPDEAIALVPDGLSPQRLRDESWRIIEPYYRRQTDQVIDSFNRARAQRTGSDDIVNVGEAAARSRIGTLLVDADKHVGGRLQADGRVEFGDRSAPDFDDLLDDIAEQVVRTGGHVLVMPTDQMPTDSGVAAIYRY